MTESYLLKIITAEITGGTIFVINFTYQLNCRPTKNTSKYSNRNHAYEDHLLVLINVDK